MPQFAVYRNPNPASRRKMPLLLEVQSDLIEMLETCVAVLLYTAAAMRGKAMGALILVMEIDGDAYVAMTPQLAGIVRKLLGAMVGDLSGRRGVIIAALNLLVAGI